MNIKNLLKRIRGNNSHRLSKISKTLRALDDIEKDIDKISRYIDFDADDTFERESQDAYTNSLSRLLTLRSALRKKRDRLESS